MQQEIPVKLLESLTHVHGFNKEAFLQAHASGEQLFSVRLNPLKQFELHNSVLKVTDAVPWCEHGRYLAERPVFTFDPLLHAGAYYVQEASSMFLWHMLKQIFGNNTKNLKVLDLCAAPGGKSTLLSSFFRDSLVLANEVIRSRASILVENSAKWGNDNIIVSNNDPKDFTALEGYFDVIIVDAPCSGSGLFRKDNEAIEEWSEENVTLCYQRQQRILSDVYPALQKNGIFIYSTCSYSREENENILDWIMDRYNVTSLPIKNEEAWGITETISENKGYGYRFYPYQTKGEGFFIAAFRKDDGEDIDHNAETITAANKQEQQQVSSLINNHSEYVFIKQKEEIVATPSTRLNDIALLTKRLNIKKPGITTGVFKGNDFIPHHELAVSLLLNNSVASVELDKDNALLFLKRKDLTVGGLPKGWILVKYCGINLGWIKVLHNRINNYYPVNWRILKD